MKTVSLQNWNNRVKTIQTKIRKEHKKYSNLGYYDHLLQPCILEYQIDNEAIVFNEDRYKEIRKEILSNPFE